MENGFLVLYLSIFLPLTFFLTLVGTRAYKNFAIRRSIIANPNFRNLHIIPTPRGAGLIFSVTFLLFATIMWLYTFGNQDLFWSISCGGLVASVFGFVDDVFDIKAQIKLIVQSILAVWILACYGGAPLINFPGTPLIMDLWLSWLALVWLMNAYNFMDGSDGMAASGAIFFSIILILALVLGDKGPTLIPVFGLLAVSCLGFLLFNRPPASIFMGDSGSLFLGYCFGALLTKTVVSGEISIWIWLVCFAYFLGDTTTTSIMRIFLVKRWYGVHRSNAYQNLVRISGSHSIVLFAVSLYHLFWLGPLVIWSTVMPIYAPCAFALAYIPVIFLSFIYGPRLSSS